MSSATWWGSNKKKINSSGPLSRDLKYRSLTLIGVRITKTGVVWRFVNHHAPLNGYNPFNIIYENEDPLLERILAAQMKEKLKAQKKP